MLLIVEETKIQSSLFPFAKKMPILFGYLLLSVHCDAQERKEDLLHSAWLPVLIVKDKFGYAHEV